VVDMGSSVEASWEQIMHPGYETDTFGVPSAPLGARIYREGFPYVSPSSFQEQHELPYVLLTELAESEGR